MWATLLSVAGSLLKRGEVGIDPQVLDAIEQVENQIGLTGWVMSAYNMYDGRYEGQGNLTGRSRSTSYVGYADKKFFSWSAAHYKKMVGSTLGFIEEYLGKAMKDVSPLAGAVFGDKKIYLYLGIGVIFIFVIVMLIARKPKKR